MISFYDRPWYLSYFKHSNGCTSRYLTDTCFIPSPCSFTLSSNHQATTATGRYVSDGFPSSSVSADIQICPFRLYTKVFTYLPQPMQLVAMSRPSYRIMIDSKILPSLALVTLSIISILLVPASSYPVHCIQIGDSTLGSVTDCDVLNDPLPFHWTSTVRLRRNVKWAGVDDVSFIYSNPDDIIEGNCTLAAPLPGSYPRNSSLVIEQTCHGFRPKLEIGANLVIMFFYTHESIDDVLMFNYPIPGYIQGEQEHFQLRGPELRNPELLEGEDKVHMWELIRQRQVKPLSLSVQQSIL